MTAEARPDGTGSVRVCVLGSNGGQVPGATVEIVGSTQRARVSVECVDFEDVPAGPVVLYVVPPPDSRLQALHSGGQRWRRDARSVVVPDGGTLHETFRLPVGDTSYGSHPDVPVAGVRGCVSVSLSARPVLGVTLTTAAGARSTETNAFGCFAFTDVAPGAGSIRIVPPPGSGLRHVTSDSRDLADGRVEVEVEPDRWNEASMIPMLAQVSQLSGRVTDQVGRPIAKAFTKVDPVGAEHLGRRAYTDADGRWSVLMPSGDHRVAIDPPNSGFTGRSYGGPEHHAFIGDAPAGTIVSTGPGEDASGLDVSLTRMLGLSGRVTDESGRPLPDVAARAYTAVGDQYAGASGLPRVGEFALGVMPGPVRVYVVARDHVGRWYGGSETVAGAKTIDVGPGDGAEGLDVVLSRGGALSGTVVDSAGRSVSPIQVSVEHATRADATAAAQPWTLLPSGEPTPVATVITDEDGRWKTEHELRSGRYILKVRGRIDSDWAPATYGVDAVGRPPRVVTVQAPARGSGHDIVIRRRGEPLLALAGPLRPTDGIIDLPISCPTGCSVDLRRASRAAAQSAARPRKAHRAPRVLARGRAKPGATRLRLRLNRTGRRAVARGSVRARVRARPAQGPSRTFTVRIRRAR